MIEKFNDVEIRGTGVVMSSMFEQIKKMHAVDQTQRANQLLAQLNWC